MIKSENIANLTEALCKLQSEIEFVQSSPLIELFRQSRDILLKHSLSVVQFCEVKESEIVVETTLLHISNEFITGNFSIKQSRVAADLQTLITELGVIRSYALASILGFVTIEPTKEISTQSTTPKKSAKPENSEIQNPREVRGEEIYNAGGVVKKNETAYEVTEKTADGGLDVCTVTTEKAKSAKCNCDDFRNNTYKDFKCEHIFAARLYYKANEITKTSTTT